MSSTPQIPIPVASDEEDKFEMGENEVVEAEVEVDPEGEEEFTHYWVPQGRASSCFDNDVSEIEVVVDPVGSTATLADASPPSETQSRATAPLIEIRTSDESLVRPSEQSAATRAIKSLVSVGLPSMLTSFSGVTALVGARTPTLVVFAAACGSLFSVVVLGFLRLFILRGEHSGLNPNPITLLHVVMTIIGFVVTSMLPPVVYYYSFHSSDNKTLKLVVVTAVSLFCILLQSIARAAVQNRPRHYLRTIGSYMTCAVVLPVVAFGVSRFVLYVSTQA